MVQMVHREDGGKRLWMIFLPDHFVDVNKMVDLKEMAHKWLIWLIKETSRESIICLQDISGTICSRKLMENEGGKEIHDQDR
jgi:hypothetical protein